MRREVVWVVDDELGAYHAVEGVAAAIGMRTEHVADGLDLFDRLEHHLPDVILVDAALRGIDGFSLVERLATHPAWKHIPAMLMLTAEDIETRRRALRAGVRDLVRLPLDRGVLEAKLLAIRSGVAPIIEAASATPIPREATDYPRPASAIPPDEAITALETALRVRQDMASMTVHDLGNPLATVMLAADLLATDALSPDARRRVQLLQGAAQRIESILDTLGRFSKLDVGILIPELEDGDPLDVVQECVAAQQFIADTKQVQLVVHTPELPLRVRFDRAMLRRVLDNLLALSLKRAPRGSSVILRMTAHTPPLVRFTVMDFGGEVTEEMREQVARAPAPLRGEQTATEIGLPLAFVAMAVDALNGEFSLDHEAPNGATFRVELPMPQSAVRPTRGALARAS